MIGHAPWKLREDLTFAHEVYATRNLDHFQGIYWNNRPIERWPLFTITTTTRIQFVFSLTLKFRSRSEGKILKSPSLHKKANPWKILVLVVK